MSIAQPQETEPETFASIMNQAREDTERTKERLQALSERQPPSTINDTDKQAINGFLSTANDVKGVMTSVTKSVKQWKAPAKQGGKGKEKGSGRKGVGFSVTQGAKNETAEMEERYAIGHELFSRDLANALKSPKYSIEVWYEGIPEASAPNIFADATYGLFCLASGIQGLAPHEMSAVLAKVLAEDLEADVLKSFEQTPINEMTAEHLYQLFQEAEATSGALNRRPRVMLLQHIMLASHSLKAALSWSRLEKGDGDNGKKHVIRAAYAAKCKAEGIAVDYDSPGCKTFGRRIRDYNTGINRFLEAYTKKRSILLLCPQLSVHRFVSPHLGPKLKSAIAQINFSEEEYQAREQVHLAILQEVIGIIGKGKQDLTSALKDINDAIGQPSRPNKRARVQAGSSSGTTNPV
ncbi:unnamed protein product [Rhizoctonia solani]|uniref:Uncharacterized protein n=1 Tax=Rhizoctonia solani TaxID=456999 RepID=A0A8H3HZZ5_9AGAM|nr:unnamed protein product [Rhizoctonia solani]